MNDLLFEFEQQFGVITADITSKTCLLHNKELPKDEVTKNIKEIQTLLNDAVELLEHMELEVRDTPQDHREKLKTRVKSYEVELKRLEGEFQRAMKLTGPDEEFVRLELFAGSNSPQDQGDDQRQRLLDNTETLERTSMRLTQSYKAAIDSEHVGAQILGDLGHQRETLSRARERLRHTDDDLNQSSRALNTMLKRAMQNKFLLGCIIAFVTFVIVTVIVVKLS